MILYHGTSKSRLNNILKFGLKEDYGKPRKHGGPKYIRKSGGRYTWFESQFLDAVTWTLRNREPVVLEFDIPNRLVHKITYEHLTHYVVRGNVPPKYITDVYVFDTKRSKWVSVE